MTEKPSVVEALSRVMKDVQTVSKRQRNTEQNYSFRGIDAVVNAVGPALREHGVVVMPWLEKASYRDVQTSRGKPSRESTVEVRYRFYGPAGDYVEAQAPGEAMDFGDKGVAKAMSVAYRIVLLQALCIPTDEPDADSTSYERAPAAEWEAAKPATDAQAALFEVLKAEVAEATAETMSAIGAKAKSLQSKGEITRMQYDALDRQAAARLAELGGAT